MERLEKSWQLASKITPEGAQSLSGYSPLLQQVLFNRGLASHEDAQRFLAAMPPEVNDPFLMKDMDVAVDRLERAILKGELVIVYGDYDADGVTATALMVQCIRALGGYASNYIPDRFEEGYGLNITALRALKEAGAVVVLTVDCGIRSIAEGEEAQRLGLDLIISDHHTPGPELPPAVAIINNKQLGDEYPDKQLAGVGTAYKIATALEQRMQPAHWNSTSVLDLVALGTVADLVPLSGENRWLVRQGIQRMRRPQRQGLLSLIGASGLQLNTLSAGDIGFMLGPRLNAAGRLDTARDAYQLLITEDIFEAGKLAQDLDNRNRERQIITAEITASAEELALEQSPDGLLMVALHPEYNPGVVGLAAARVAERYYRPAIVGQIGPEFTRASCRSIPEFHITKALETCADLFRNFGGHAAAAGFTIQNERVPEMLERLRAYTAAELGAQELRPTLLADAELPLVDLKPDVMEHLDLLEPTGYGNPQVNLISRGLQVRNARTVGSEAKHLKLTVSQGGIVFDAIAFRQGHWMEKLPLVVDLLYRFEVNEFRGQKRFQLNVRDLKASV
jgi:single-stranded-DNA-specific exonuclease